MYRIMNNINILEIIKRRPVNLVVILFLALRGFFRRKFGIYNRMTLDKRIQHLNTKRGIVTLQQVGHDVDKWQKAFAIRLTTDFKWDRERDEMLELFFGELTASGSIPLATNDKENYWSAVQLNWLFFSVRTGSKGVDDSRLLMLACCKLLQNNKGHWLYRTFTVSEAISNIVKIKLFFGDALDIDDEIEEFLVDGIKYVCETLEIYSFSSKTSLNYTNNHILANTRALFWATKICNNTEVFELAKYVFETSCLPLFDDGNLDEGSVTYHMIATQCIFDIAFFLPYKILPRVDLLVSELDKAGFLQPDTFPFIGDISPDPSLASVIDDSVTIAKLIDEAIPNSGLHICKGNVAKRFCSDFEFHAINNWHLLLHARGGDKHIQHSHNDYGSPVLLYKGNPIICDLGRTSYAKVEGLIDLTSSGFHSVPQLGILEQNPRGARDVYPDKYITPKVTDITDCDISLRKLQLLGGSDYDLICGKEYNLLADKVLNGSWSRFFGVGGADGNEFIIEDIIDLGIERAVNFRIFMPEKTGKEPICTVNFLLNAAPISPSVSKVPRSSYYGDVSEANCYQVSVKSSHKYNFVTRIRILNE